MNQDSLNHYKSQVYNPGSPHPSPVSEPFKVFPKNRSFSSAKPDPENPLKITFSSKRKRDFNDDTNSSQESPVKSPSKKLKMISKEDAKEFFDGLTKQFEEKQAKVNAGMVNDMGALSSEGRESRSRLGLETEGTETLGLVSVSYKILELVSSRSRLG